MLTGILSWKIKSFTADLYLEDNAFTRVRVL